MPPTCALIVALAPFPVLAASPAWPQFRGPNGSGVAPDEAKLPDRMGPGEHEIWRVSLPPGHSSPVVGEDRIFLTGERDGRLVTLALAERTGKLLWEKDAPHGELETTHPIGSRAQPSPATDGDRVVSFFGSAGLFCYGREGRLLWQRPMGPFRNTFGAGSSPVIAGDRVILLQDHDTDSFIMALDKKSGETLWRTDRSEFPRGFATPLVWETPSGREVVAAGTLRVAGYDLTSGRELWTVRGLARICIMTPVVGSTGVLYVAAWSPGGDETDRIETRPFTDVQREQDADASGTLELSELPEGPLRQRFDQIDRDKDGRITRDEYEFMRTIFEGVRNGLLAIRPGGRGDVTATHVLWRQSRFLPYVPSPACYRGHLFMVKNGGIVSSLDARSGEVLRTDRVSGRSEYYSSPVCGDGKVYLLSRPGELSVITAEAEWRELSTTDLGEEAFATPAIAGGRFYVRTREHLWCFGLREDGPGPLQGSAAAGSGG